MTDQTAPIGEEQAEDAMTPWDAMIEALKPLGRQAERSAPDAGSDQSRADALWMLLTGMGQFVANFRAQDRSNPQFTPLLNNGFNQGAPVPDYMYQTAPIDDEGVYRISGVRGTSLFVELQFMDGLDGIRTTGKALGNFALDTLHIGEDGRFSVLLSAARPQGYEGDWRPLDPGATSILVRHASYDWLNEVDARLAIERLDRPVTRGPVPPSTVDAALAALPSWAGGRVATWNNHIRRKREAGPVNTLEVYDVSKTGSLAGQVYFEGLFDIAEHEALIVETDLPEKCLYWSILLGNDQYATIDWTAHQSSLNGHQARIDSDGRFRAVIARRDPGVANWLDTGGYARGCMQFRWKDYSSAPVPTITCLPFDRLLSYLPHDTPRLSPEDRERTLRKRREGAQLRRRW